MMGEGKALRTVPAASKPSPAAREPSHITDPGPTPPLHMRVCMHRSMLIMCAVRVSRAKCVRGPASLEHWRLAPIINQHAALLQ